MREDRSALVVIPCLNEARHLPALLHTLSQDAASSRIVVVDGGSTDRSREIVREAARDNPLISLLENPLRRQSAGINLAVERFGHAHRWLVRVDAHCSYPDNYVSGLVDAAERKEAGSVVVPMVTRGATGCFQRGVAAAQNSLLGTGGSAHRHVGAGKWVEHGHHALMDLSAFSAVGGYSLDFQANEDAELDIRLTRQGTRIWLEPDLAITYFPRNSPWRLAVQYFRYGRGRAKTVKRHRSKMRLRQILPLAVMPALLLALVSPVLPPFSWALALPFAAYAAISILYGLVLALRAKSTCVAWSGPAAMVMHAAWSAGFWVEWFRRDRSPENDGGIARA